MIEETGKKIEDLIDKLFKAPPKSRFTSLGKRSGEMPSLVGRKRTHSSSMGMNLVDNESLSTVSGSSKLSQAPTCRPWDRDDFFSRLSTFKSITWFAKPQVVSPLECARRGWINSDIDTIVCSYCGARFLFATPSSWTQQQVEKAAMVFSLKLESGHKMLCPWINNACAEDVAHFPDVSSRALAEDYKRRIASLSQLIALPAISPAISVNFKSSQLMQYLEVNWDSRNSNSMSSLSYYQAQKLISLLGWEPYLLPHEVDAKYKQQHSIEDAAVEITGALNQRVNVYSLFTSDGTRPFSELQFDPSSVILHCKLCGASVGLWTFNNIPRNLEYIRVVGQEEVNGKRSSVHNDVSAQEGSSGVTLFTIAGGPPPAHLDYAVTISIPILGKNLRSRIGMETEDKDPVALEVPSQVEESRQILNKNESFSSEGPSPLSLLDSLRTVEPTIESKGGKSELNKGEMVEAGKSENCSSYPSGFSGDASKSLSIGTSLEFNPFKQHKSFCPWVLSTGKFTPGWQQTLSALERKENFTNLTDSSVIKVHSPVATVSKLFTNRVEIGKK